MIGGLNVAAIAFALAACALTIAVAELVGRALHWIEDRWNARTARAQRDEAWSHVVQVTELIKQIAPSARMRRR